MDNRQTTFPAQQLPFSKKTKVWRKQVIDWADSKTFFNYSLVRKSVIHKKINYDLLNGKIHMQDLIQIVNPQNIQANYIPDKIQHYPIMNGCLNVLRGEEASRIFDYRVVVTNPNAISEIETEKRDALFNQVQELIASQVQSEEEFNAELNKINEYYSYEWQDLREMRGNALLQHYSKELNFKLIFNTGFVDAMAVGEELYQCDIIGGEPTIERLNPNKVTIYKSGYSNKVEDADMIIITDYWSPGKIIDTYYDVLSEKDIKYIESLPTYLGTATDNMDNIDDRQGFIYGNMIDDTFSSGGEYFDPFGAYSDSYNTSLLPYDLAGNVRILKVYWKSRRKIKKIKSFDLESGEPIYNFYPETYILNKDLGETEEIFYINEAWEGTKIGQEVYVNMRPRVIQYNRLSNPSRCHFGIVGSIYNLNDSRPFSMVDIMKPYNYQYDALQDKLQRMIASNAGKLTVLDLAKVPKGWDIEKWMYFAKMHNILVVDSFKEGNSGAAMGKLAGGMNNASSGVVDAELGNSIQNLINILEFLKMEMFEVAGISRQRLGQISNRETVGGIERSTLQSSHITEYLFSIHDDVKKRAIECFLETAKIALKGRSKKFNYILPDATIQLVDIDGDEFSECDYGLVVENGQGLQELSQKLDMLAQAALQNQALSFSTIMKIYNSSSLAEKQRLIEKDEKAIQERNSQAQQQQIESEQQIAQMEIQQRQAELEQKESANIRDNETKILIANINAESNYDDGIKVPDSYTQEDREELMEKIRQFNEKIKLEREKFNFEKEKHRDDVILKNKTLNKKPTKTK